MPGREVQKTSTQGSRIRGVELARQAGVSVQAVRNYERAGLLPPVPRSPGGHREFDESHRRALAASRAMVAAHGWDDAVEIMAAVHRDDLPAAITHIDRIHAQLAAQREHVQQALSAVEIAVTRPDDPQSHTAATLDRLASAAPLRIGHLAHVLGLPTSTLRFWERVGLVRPTREPTTGYRIYDATAARDAHLVYLLRQGDFPMTIIRAALDEMHSARNGRPERVRAALQQREQQLNEQSLRRLRANATLTAYIDWRQQGRN